MTDERHEKIEGLGPKGLFRTTMAQSDDDPAAAARAADEEQRIRAEIEARLPDLELIELLGRGGMGHVYRARQKKLDREVALKVIVTEEEGDFAERFAREAQALARLNHPNLVTVYDYGQEGRFGWLVMEYVDGSNLRDLIRAGKLEPAEALAMVPKICDALQYAHDQGVVHRDVKPENILVDREGGVKIADFGLAKLIGTPAALVSLTGSKQVLGTFRYMAPEQLNRPLEVDHRADIYSLGVVFYEMLTGEIPMGRFDPPSAHSTAPPDVDEVVLRALEKEPERRYQHASDVKSDLESVKRGERPAAAPREPRAKQRGSSAPKLSLAAVAATVLFSLGFCSVLLVSGALVMANGGTPMMAGGRLGFARILMMLPVLLGILLMVAGCITGFTALDRIRRCWPDLYGVLPAAIGAWGGILVVVNALILVLARGFSNSVWISTASVLVWTLLLFACDAIFVAWYHRRFLRGCESAQ
jgi:tRNA A-37 threonylcarbamoyl transferase component Bud32